MPLRDHMHWPKRLRWPLNCPKFVKKIKGLPKAIKNPIQSALISPPTKQHMIDGSLDNSFPSVLHVSLGLEESIDSLANRWLKWDKEPATKIQINEWKDSCQIGQLEAALRNRIQFGTAGLRGAMRAGFANINSLIIIQTSQGLAQYILDQQPDAKIKGVVVGYDTRNNSPGYAKLAASAFYAKGIKVHWFEGYVPTPFVSFAVKYLNAAAGVMITASHNPKDDNGYKVYWSNGAQINSPHDAGISKCILANQEPWPTAWDYGTAFLNDRFNFAKVEQVDLKIHSAYVAAVGGFALGTACIDKTDMSKFVEPFIYTPLHGVGYKYFKKVASSIGVLPQMIVVPEQAGPDPNFSTIAFPNPEEDNTFDLAIKAAESNGRRYIIMNDPDADRFAVAERVESRWHKFTGDQVGVLLASHLQPSVPSKNNFMLTTAVSSSMLSRMPGFRSKETLTGFKWLGNEAYELEGRWDIVTLFGYEEALGYMFPRISYDKDGLAAAAVFLVALAQWTAHDLTPFSQLQLLYQQYGYFETLNLSFRSKPEDPEAIFRTFENFRKQIYPWDDKKPKLLRLGAHDVLQFRDLTTGEAWSRSDGQFVPGLPVSKDVQMITFWVEWRKNTIERSRFTLRSSGTEPKLKLYLECYATSQDRAVFLIKDLLECIDNEILRRNGPLTQGWENKMVSSSSGSEFRFPRPREFDDRILDTTSAN